MNTAEEQPIKIRHHYVPVCYLRMFTPSQSSDDVLNAVDLDTGNQWPSCPERLAFENHYNSVDGDLRPDSFEDAFAQVETGAAPVWHKMIAEKQVPTDPHDLNWIMNFLALLQARTKPNRKAIFDMYVASIRAMTNLATSTPEIFSGQIAKMKKDGVELPEFPDGVTLEDIRRKMRDGSIVLTADIHNNYYLERMMEHIDLMLHMFHDRHWKVCDLSSSSVNLITSDDPVSVVWAKPMPPIHPPGFGMNNTIVIVPLSSKSVLLGAFNPELLDISGSTELAKKINHITLGHSFRFVYSGDTSFDFIDATNTPEHPATIEGFVKHRAVEQKGANERSYVNQFGPLLILSRPLRPTYLAF